MPLDYRSAIQDDGLVWWGRFLLGLLCGIVGSCGGLYSLLAMLGAGPGHPNFVENHPTGFCMLVGIVWLAGAIYTGMRRYWFWCGFLAASTFIFFVMGFLTYELADSGWHG